VKSSSVSSLSNHFGCWFQCAYHRCCGYFDDLDALEDEDDLWSRFVGKTPLTIIVELQLDARYELLAETEDQLHPLFAMSVTIEGESFRAAGTSKRLAKARAARDALRKLYNLEFGVSESK